LRLSFKIIFEINLFTEIEKKNTVHLKVSKRGGKRSTQMAVEEKIT
jgi:hypothetical protein